MPPRKSGASAAGAVDANGDVSMVSNATNATASPTQHAHPKQSRQSGGGQQGKQDDGVGIDDLLLPRSLVSRLSRGVLPPNTSLQKDALLALTRSATVFISYLAHHANEQSQLRHRKTLGIQDVYSALKEIELAGVMDVGAVGEDGRTGGRLEREVAMFEEAVMRKRKGYREKVKARESGGGVEGQEDRGEPSSKKARRMSEQDEAEDERMLEQQLNGPTHAEPAAATSASGDADQTSLVQRGHGTGTGKEKAKPASDGRDEDEELEEADDAEDDPAGDDDDHDHDDDDQDEADDDDDDDDDEEAEEGDEEDRDGDGSTLSKGLLPNGEVEIESDEESDG